MTNLNDLFNIDIWSIAKWFYVGGFALYTLFSLVVLRQINLMSTALAGTLQLPIKLVGLILVITSLGVTLLALMVL